MKICKKVLSVMLAVLMLVCSAPLDGFVGIDISSWFTIEAEAASSIITGDCGEGGDPWSDMICSDNVKYRLDLSTGVMEIYGIGATSNFSAAMILRQPWRQYKSYIKEVIIYDGVTYLGSGAFALCDNLENVYFPSSLTAVGNIAFAQSNYALLPNLKQIFYGGTKSQYDSISNAPSSSSLKITYNYDFYSLYDNPAQLSIKIVDDFTSRPVKNCTITIEGIASYPVDDNGIFILNIESAAEFVGKEIVVSSAGYTDYKFKLYMMHLNRQNVIELGNKNGYKVDITNIFYSKQTIDGPYVTIGDKEFPLFTIDIGVDLSKIPGLEAFKHLRRANNIKIDEANHTIKILLGVGDGYEVKNDNEWESDYDSFRDYYRSYQKGLSYEVLESKYKKLADNLGPVDTDMGLSVSCTFCGYCEIDYSSGKAIIKEGGLVLNATADISQEIPYGFFFSATFGVKGTAEGKIVFARETLDDSNENTSTPGHEILNSDVYLSAMASLEANPYFKGSVTLISEKLLRASVGLEAKIKGTIKAPADSLKEAISLLIGGKAFVQTNVICVGESKLIYPFPDIQLYPECEVVRPLSYNSKTYSKENNINPISREYLDTSEYKSSTFSLKNSTLSDENVYPYSEPKLAKLANGNIMAFWLKDDGTKTDNNRTTLYYSVYENGFWSSPAPVFYSEFCDSYVEVAVVENDVHIVWQRANTVFDDEVKIEDVLESMDLVYSCYKEGEFSEPIVISNNNNKYQGGYSIAAESDTVIVGWLENSNNSYSFSEGESTIYSRICSNGVWEEVSEVETVQNISSFVCGFIESEPKIAYTTLSFNTDKYLSSIKINDVVYDADEYSALTYQDGMFYFIKNDGLCCYNNSSFKELGVMPSNDYSILNGSSEKVIIFTVNDGFKNELFISYFIDGKYTTPIAFSSFGKHISAYSAVMQDSAVMIFANINNMSESENEFPFTTTDLICELIDKQTDIKISEPVVYDYRSLVPGESSSFVVTVSNNGSSVIDNYSINIKDGNNVVKTFAFSETLLPGENKDNTITYTLSDNFEKTQLTFEVITENDINTSNNYKDITIGNSDIELVDCYYKNGMISGKIKNKGYDIAVNPVIKISYFDNEEIKLSELSFNDILAGDEENFSFEIPDEYIVFEDYYDENRYMISVDTDSTEIRYDNNSLDLIGRPIKAESLSINQKEVVLALCDTYQLEAIVMPENAINRRVVWISGATNVAEVDKNGVVTGINPGVAKIRAISEDGDYVAECVVSVIANATEIAVTDIKNKLVKDITYKFNTTLSPEQTDETIVWESSNDEILSVTNEGVATPKKLGTATLTVMSSRGSVTKSFDVEVVELSVDSEDENLYHINNSDDLLILADMVNAGISLSNKVIKLNNDIDLTGVNWVPIGDATNPFSGVFDGSEHTISGLNCQTADVAYSGLFGFIKTGGVKNLTVEGLVSGNNRVGMIAGYITDSALYNCKAMGEVNRAGSGAFGYVGGLVGTALHSVIINCAAETDINVSFESSITYATVGGIVGAASTSNSEPMCILNSYCIGDIHVAGNQLGSLGNPQYYVGGIAGYLKDDAVNNYYHGTIVDIDESSVKEIGYAFGYIGPEFSTETDYNGIGTIIVSDNYYPEGETAICSIASGDYDTTEWTEGISEEAFLMLTGEGSLVDMLNGNKTDVEDIIVAHRDILSNSTWAELVDRINGDSFTVSSWKIGSNNLPVNYECDCYSHAESDWIIDVEATCTKEGSKHTYCLVCKETISTESIEKFKHTGGTANCQDKAVCDVCGEAYGDVNADNHKSIVTDKAVSATCTTTGLIEGSHCEACGVVIVAQVVTSMLAHTEETIPAVSATCTSTGLTEGKKCSVCGEVTVAQTVTLKLSHTEEIVKGYAATCTKKGLTDGKKCSVCGEVTVKQTEIANLPHTEKMIKGYAPTCTAAGLSDGVKCSSCGTVLVKQTTIKATGHKDDNGDYMCDNNCGYIFEIPDEPSPPDTSCSCNCHKDGFMGFIWKIVCFFQKLFKTNQYCSCGARHW